MHVILDAFQAEAFRCADRAGVVIHAGPADLRQAEGKTVFDGCGGDDVGQASLAVFIQGEHAQVAHPASDEVNRGPGGDLRGTGRDRDSNEAVIGELPALNAGSTSRASGGPLPGRPIPGDVAATC